MSITTITAQVKVLARGAPDRRLLSVGEPRVSRLLDQGVSRLRDEVRRCLRETPPGDGTGEEDLWRALGEAMARLMASSGPGRL